MRNVYITGIGQTPVGEHWDRSLIGLAVESLRRAQAEVSLPIDALYVANAYAGELGGQTQLGAAIAAAAGLDGVEALRIEAAGASGGVALRQAHLAVASGAYDIVAVVGVEKATDVLDATVEAALASALDADYEAAHGLTLTAGWALLQRRYMHAYNVDAAAFVPFPVNAHRNAAANPNAQYRMAVKPETVLKSARIADPIALLDSSTPADGAATVIIAAEHVARELGGALIRIAGAAVATGAHALGSRSDLLTLPAVARSTEAALRQARIAHADVDLLELSDQHGIVAALALECAGFAARGEATRLAADGAIARGGALPLATMGGCKARGDAIGALGVYQAVELVQQLRGDAGGNQVAPARIAFAQCLGGLGSTAATHVLVREG